VKALPACHPQIKSGDKAYLIDWEIISINLALAIGGGTLIKTRWGGHRAMRHEG